MPPPINRLTQGNGRSRTPEVKRSADDQSIALATAAGELKSVLRDHPGTVLLIGLVAGGILGWLTSRRSR